jgi:hypothetical protein
LLSRDSCSEMMVLVGRRLEACGRKIDIRGISELRRRVLG